MYVKIGLLFFGAAIVALSTYIYWPIWKEINGRTVDNEMTQKTNLAIKHNKVDPVYLKVAEGTGGSICSADGETAEEKNKNIQKCFEAMSHRELVKNMDTQIRQRFLTIKRHFFNIAAPIFFILWAFVFYLVFDRTTQIVPVVLISTLPNIAFWITIGGLGAFLHPELHFRGGMHLPLFGALLTAFLVWLSQRHFSDSTLSKWQNRLTITVILLIGFIPCGFILLMAGSC